MYPVRVFTTYINPGDILRDEDLLINAIKPDPAFKVRIFSELIFHPGKVHVAEKIKIISPGSQLFENPGMAFLKNKFAPDLHHIHICIDKQEFILVFRRSEERRVGKECRCGWVLYVY